MYVRRLVRAALIAAMYVVLCLVLEPFSFGPMQVRVSEALTLLPVLCPEAVVGVTLGCFLANMFASAPLDMIVGTAATLLAALATRRLRNIRWKKLPLVASIPPVIINAVVVGAELTFLYSPGAPASVWAFNMLTVGAGQVISCCVLGVLMIAGIEQNKALTALFASSPKLG